VCCSAASATISDYDSGVRGTIESQELSNIGGINLPVIESEAYSVNAADYDKPMTKDEFCDANSEYIKYLEKQFGEENAHKIVDAAYDSTNKLSTLESTTIVRINSNDMYLWPYHNDQTSTSSWKGCINAIFFDKTVDEMAAILKGTGNWGSAEGWTEWGLHGPNLNNMVWTNSPGYNPLGNHQLEDGSFFGNRYHLVLTDGHYSSSLGDYWCYGNCHYEYWSWSGYTHYLYSNSFNTGRNHLYSELSGYASVSSINLLNAWSGYFSGTGYIFNMN
jgi:hypothetical protein